MAEADPRKCLIYGWLNVYYGKMYILWSVYMVANVVPMDDDDESSTDDEETEQVEENLLVSVIRR